MSLEETLNWLDNAIDNFLFAVFRFFYKIFNRKHKEEDEFEWEEEGAENQKDGQSADSE
jgi:hypothetical protein